MSLQKYDKNSIGITPHKDGKSRINIICVFNLMGKAKFALCDDRFILFTKDYQEFCNKFFGRYIHHGPILSTKISSKPVNGMNLFAIAEEVFAGSLNVANWLGPNATSWVGCDADAEEHEPNCPCTDCEYERYLKTPGGKAELKLKEDKRKKDLALRKPLTMATEKMEETKRLVKEKEVELKKLKSDTKRLETILKSLFTRMRELRRKEKKNRKALPKLKKTLEAADKKVQQEKERYDKTVSDNPDV